MSDWGTPGSEVLEFGDNRLVRLLHGEHDRHLALIEGKTGAGLFPKGNRILVQGEVEARGHAIAVLKEIYGKLEASEPVGVGEVEAAIRFAGRAREVGAETLPRRPIVIGRKLVEPRNEAQATYIAAMREAELVFGIGPAGTGKTFIAVARAVEMLVEGFVQRVVLTRPAVEAGERLGFLPGDLREKIDPYMIPLYDSLYALLGKQAVERRLDQGSIEVAPLAYMRGRTLSDAFVILDEGQNTTPVQMKMFLTRLGDGSRMVITGDPSQVDLPPAVDSGLAVAERVLKDMPGARFVRFSASDVHRHPLVGEIVRAYAAHEAREGTVRPAAAEDRPRRGVPAKRT